MTMGYLWENNIKIRKRMQCIVRERERGVKFIFLELYPNKSVHLFIDFF